MFSSQYTFNDRKTTSSDHKRRPIQVKQSFRWIESLRTTTSLCQPKSVVTISDRESDIFEFFAEAQELRIKVLVRAARDRILVIEAKEDSTTLWTYMKKKPLEGLKTTLVPAQQNRPERQVTLEVRYSEVMLKPPQRFPGAKEKALSPIRMQAV